MNLITVDPGKKTGWAVFRKGELVAAGVTKSENMFRSIRNRPRIPVVDCVCIEAPRWYPHEHKIDVNDLLDLSVYVGEIKRFYQAQGIEPELVWPRTWKGTAPKKITNDRTVEKLSKEELACLTKRPKAKDYDHNMLDAVGLGLWKLGRLR